MTSYNGLPSGPNELERDLRRLRDARALEHDIEVLADRARQLVRVGRDRAGPERGGQLGSGVAAFGDDDGVDTSGAERGDRHQADRSGADDADHRARRGPAPSHAVQRDRVRLDQRAMLGGHARREREAAATRDADVLGERAVEPTEAEPVGHALDAQRAATFDAARARSASAEREDADPQPDEPARVVDALTLAGRHDSAGELVAHHRAGRQHARAAEVEVAAADAAALDRDHRLAGPGARLGLVDDDQRPVGLVRDCPHEA